MSNMFIYNFTKQWLKTSKIAVILKICVGFRGAAPDPAGGASTHPRPLAKRLAPSALCIFFLPFRLAILAVPVLYIKNLKLYPGLLHTFARLLCARNLAGSMVKSSVPKMVKFVAGANGTMYVGATF